MSPNSTMSAGYSMSADSIEMCQVHVRLIIVFFTLPSKLNIIPGYGQGSIERYQLRLIIVFDNLYQGLHVSRPGIRKY